MWPDLELVATTYLSTTVAARVVTRLPSDLEDQLPLVRVSRGPGSDDGITDSPLLDVEAFAADRAGMWDLAEQARQAMHALAGTAVDGRLVDTVTTATGPVRVDYGNPAIHRAAASYRMALRQITTASS